MVLFFANKNKELLKTKLMKLLNYSDMVFYKENGISISGARYAHLPYVPVPVHYDILFGFMVADHIAHIEVTYDNGYEKHQVIAEEDMPEGVLSKDEIAVLERVYENLQFMGQQIFQDIRIMRRDMLKLSKGKSSHILMRRIFSSNKWDKSSFQHHARGCFSKLAFL